MSVQEDLKEFDEEVQRSEYLEHRDVLLAIGLLLKQKEGQQLFKYLFKSFEVGTIPDQSMEGNMLHDYLGFLRAGNSIFKLACEADSTTAASLLSKIEREKYERIQREYTIRNQQQ